MHLDWVSELMQGLAHGGQLKAFGGSEFGWGSEGPASLPARPLLSNPPSEEPVTEVSWKLPGQLSSQPCLNHSETFWRNERAQLLELEKRNPIPGPEREREKIPLVGTATNPGWQVLADFQPQATVSGLGRLTQGRGALSKPQSPPSSQPGEGEDLTWPSTGSLSSCVNVGELLSNLCASLTSKVGVKLVPASQALLWQWNVSTRVNQSQ